MSSRKRNTANQVLIACDDHEIVTHYTEVLGDNFTLTCCANWAATIDAVSRDQQQVLLLDPELVHQVEPDFTTELFAVSPDSRIIILETLSGPAIDQVTLFKMGVHGFCHCNITPELLNKAVNAVFNGELWMQRSLITRVIDDLARNRRPRAGSVDHPASKNVECLTPRELEVARMVHQGGNNKTIARKLDISERTVKAHLSAIFRKLNIENRLHLAIFFNDVT